MALLSTAPSAGGLFNLQEHLSKQLWDGDPIVNQRPQQKTTGQSSPERCQTYVML